jgi:hypothetical protein
MSETDDPRHALVVAHFRTYRREVMQSFNPPSPQEMADQLLAALDQLARVKPLEEIAREVAALHAQKLNLASPTPDQTSVFPIPLTTDFYAMDQRRRSEQVERFRGEVEKLAARLAALEGRTDEPYNRSMTNLLNRIAKLERDHAVEDAAHDKMQERQNERIHALESKVSAQTTRIAELIREVYGKEGDHR